MQVNVMSINEHVMMSSDQRSSLCHPTRLLICEPTRGLPCVQCTENRLKITLLSFSGASSKFQEISRSCRHRLNSQDSKLQLNCQITHSHSSVTVSEMHFTAETTAALLANKTEAIVTSIIARWPADTVTHFRILHPM